MKRNPVDSLRKLCAVVLCGGILLVADSSVSGQGTVDPLAVLRTGAGQPLVTGMQSFFIPASTNAQQIQLAFGFATDENPLPETFFDSATLTLQDELATVAAIFFSVDCTGLYWTPSGGTVVIDPATISSSSIPFPNLLPAYTNRTALYLTLPVPASMTGKQLNLYLDLFDNQDAFGSLAWMSQVSVVPEPSSAVIAMIGATLFVACRRFFRS